jgi:glycosyltransferase involved in cell wall biosynthesis
MTELRIKPAFSVIIPARDEEKFIGNCVESVKAAFEGISGTIEIVVVLNRCTDRTEEIALQKGAVVVFEDEKSMGKIRNAGAKASTSDNLVFIDADSVMPRGLLADIAQSLDSGEYLGGGVDFELSRNSLGISITMAITRFFAAIMGIMGVVIWLKRDVFEALGGFDENRPAGEDIDFAKRLRAYCISHGSKYRIIRDKKVVTSSRKFDKLGDWFVIRHPLMAYRLVKGEARESANLIWYDIDRK